MKVEAAEGAIAMAHWPGDLLQVLGAVSGDVESGEKLEALIQEATVDAHDEDEQRMGFRATFEDHLRLPFSTEILGVAVTVDRLDVRNDRAIVAICRRGTARQAISILDLPPPDPPPPGAEWIEAYRRWLGEVLGLYRCALTKSPKG